GTARPHHPAGTGTALGSLRVRPSYAADGTALLGRASDPSSTRLCRAALYLRRSRPYPGRRARTRRLDQLSRYHHRGARQRRRRSTLAQLVSLSPVGGLARWTAATDADADRPAVARLGRRRARSRDTARATAARRAGLRSGGWGLERGTRPAALRAAVR